MFAFNTVTIVDCAVNIINIVRLSSGDKIGVLSQGPTIVYDVKMIGLKVASEIQKISM